MAKTNARGMTDQMFLFCQGYVKRGFKDAPGAYLEAYPKCGEKAAESSASRTLRNAKVSAYLAEVQAKAQERTQITADQVLAELGKLGFADMRDYADWGPDGVTLKASSGMEPGMTAAVCEVTETVGEKGGSIKFKLHDKRAGPSAPRRIRSDPPYQTRTPESLGPGSCPTVGCPPRRRHSK